MKRSGEVKRGAVAVTCVPDAEAVIGGRVVWDNDSQAECTECGFTGKVSDFL
jgi:hypothetical protein